jgi:hypothetical protein
LWANELLNVSPLLTSALRDWKIVFVRKHSRKSKKEDRKEELEIKIRAWGPTRAEKRGSRETQTPTASAIKHTGTTEWLHTTFTAPIAYNAAT